MLLTNRLNFFDKRGNEINLLPETAITVTVIDPTNSGGYGADFNVYTNRNGHIECLEIISGGHNYDFTGLAYLQFENNLTGYIWNTDPADLSVDPISGAISSFSGLAIPNGSSNWPSGNAGFAYPNVTWKGEMYFDRVSTGLIENQDIFILEKVKIPSTIFSRMLLAPGVPVYHSFPRADEGPSHILGYYSNTKTQSSPGVTSATGTGTARVKVYSFTGNFLVGNNRMYNLSSTTGLLAGMIIEGAGIPVGTTIVGIINVNTIEVSSTFKQTVTGGAITAYTPHGFVGGMRIRIGDSVTTTPLDGTYTVTGVSEKEIFFSTPETIPNIVTTLANSTSFFRAAPLWRGQLIGAEEEIFLFTIEYGEDFPVITKNNIVTFDPINGDSLVSPDTYFTGGETINNKNGQWEYREVSEDLQERMMHFSLGFSADTEGSYIRLFVLEDITFPYAPTIISQISLRGEAEGVDDRLGRLLQNFGRDVTEEQELIMRNSDVNEDLPNFLLLNSKRKEMLLQGDQIWPYLGSYRGLVNIVNWFGYYDLRIKEYWLNINENDPYYGKYKQIQIPFQLEEKGLPFNIDMLPSKVYKKTNKFGLFYDINKESGVLDENGVPLTVDAFQFSNEEILIKLFALKRYLINNFLPLNTQIVDIVGEGVYYERYAANTWNDQVNQTVVDLTRQIDFSYTNANEFIPIEDARPYDVGANAYTPEPGVNTVGSYYATYNITDVIVSASPAVLRVPTVHISTLSGNASPSRTWEGKAFLKAVDGSYSILGANSSGGINYKVGDIITLNGGVFSTPIRIKVTTVNGAGTILDFDVVTGYDQGSRYYSLPTAFSQTYVVSQDLVNNLYYSSNATGCKIDALDIQYYVEGIKTTTIGKGYSITDPLILTTTDPLVGTSYSVTCTFTTLLKAGPKVGYFNQGAQLIPLTNEPNVPVGAFLGLETLGLDVAWKDMTFSWQELWSAEDATIQPYIDPLPAGTGGVVALEILHAGSGYTQTPFFQFNGGGGFNASAQAKLKNGKLALLEYVSTSAVVAGPSTDIYFSFSITPIPFSVGAMVTGIDSLGTEILKPSIITFVDPAGAYITINTIFNAAPGNIDIKIHEGALLGSAGSGYVSLPDVKTYGGHTTTLYTWDEIGRGNFYEMEWKVESEPETPTFTYSSGRKSIDQLMNHEVILPYKGFYKVELIAYDTDNNWINEIKRYYIKAVMPEATPGIIARFIGASYHPGEPTADGGTGSPSNALQLSQNCVDTWDEAFYQWDEFWGRWINPIKTWTTWNDCQVEWGTLEVTPLSFENNWSYPAVTDNDVYRVSAYDDLIGQCDGFIAAFSRIIVVGPFNANSRPPVSTGEVLFLRRDELVFQVVVQTATYPALPSTNVIWFDLAPGSTWPQNFESNPKAWEVLREVGGTVVIKDDLYTPGNGKTLVPGQYITLEGTNDTPLNNTHWNLSQPPEHWGIPIFGRSDSNIVVEYSYGNNDLTSMPWVNGEIYQYRNQSYTNGNLFVWDKDISVPINTVYLEKLEDPTEDNWGNRGMFYINKTENSPYTTNADPLKEIRGGFTEFDLIVAKPNKTLWWNAFLNTFNQPAFTVKFNAMVYRQHPATVNTIYLLPYELWGVDAFFPGQIRSYSVEPLTFQSNIPISSNPLGKLIYVPTNDSIYISDTVSSNIYVFECSTFTVVNTITLPAGSDYEMVYTNTNDNILYVLDTGGPLYRIDCATNVYTVITSLTTPSGIEYAPLQKNIWVTNSTSGTYTVNIINADPGSSSFDSITTSPSLGQIGGPIIKYMPGMDCMLIGSVDSGADLILIKCNPFGFATSVTPPSDVTSIVDAVFHEADGHFWLATSNSAIPIIVYDPRLNIIVTSSITGLSFHPASAIMYNPRTNSVFFSYATRTFEIFGKLFKKGETLYQQHFRTINAYEDNSNQGHPYDIWSEPANSKIICIEAVTLDGKKFDEIYQKLVDLGVDGIDVFAWIEYKYTVFPTRTHSLMTQNQFFEITLDYNNRPVLGIFEDSYTFPANSAAGTGWYYDAGISEGNYAQKVLNVGEFLETSGWTIVTVDDPNSELYRCDASFVQRSRDFDEDNAETHLGVKLGWDEIKTLDWNAMCSQTWTTTDWNYNLPVNFKFALANVATPTYLQLNEYPECYVALDYLANPQPNYIEEGTVFLVNFLNNNIYDINGIWKANDNPGTSRFYYELRSGTGRIDEGYYSWGDPSSALVFGDNTVAAIGDFVLATFIQPGWRVNSVSTPGQISFTASANSIGGTVPWIPSCSIHVDAVAGSKMLKNITGFPGNTPLGGWLWDPISGTVFGEFGPGVGPVVTESGFVRSLVMNAVASSTDTNIWLEVYPKRSGRIQFLDAPVSTDYLGLTIFAYAKNPGTDALGYVKYNGSILGYPNDRKTYDDSQPVSINHNFPTGNYYNWIQDLDTFYGGGLENSLLQFTQPYRNIQNYIYNGGKDRLYNADGGGWYPGIDWSSYALPPEGLWYINPGVNINGDLAYKPTAKVLLYYENGAPLQDDLYGADLYLFLNEFYDGSAIICDSNGTTFNFVENSTGFPLYTTEEWPVHIKVCILSDIPGISKTFNAVIVDPYNGILGKNAIYFLADYENAFSYQEYELTNIKPALYSNFSYVTSAAGLIPSIINSGITAAGGSGSGITFDIATGPAGTITGINLSYPGYGYAAGDTLTILGTQLSGGTAPADNITITIIGSNYWQSSNPLGMLSPGSQLGNFYTPSGLLWKNSKHSEIISIENDIITGSAAQDLGVGSNIPTYAYTPLYLDLKLQPTNPEMWSRTQQWQSMRLEYEDSINPAFTWEDTTISIREKKIPAGTSVLFTSDPSTIAGKTKFVWNLYQYGEKLVSIIDPDFLWTFLEAGYYDLELIITDTNGNTQNKYCENYIEVFVAEHSFG